MLLQELAQTEMRETRGGDRKSKSTRATLIEPLVAPTLADLGLTRDQSSKWQKLAQIPEAEFEAALRDPDKKPSTAALIREIRDPIAARVQRLPDDALWLWGRLCDFERDGFAAKKPRPVLNTMTDAMQADVRRIAPMAIAFLSAMIGETDDDA
ncbi:hypothetical protein [Caballeronia sp. TF1N1]|uniref:hypothetical protein n=1 Tax=Caballeronia sp. TF1N1 TaxID=2878153 RepID=UPI001FD2276D|nr:hypothetical protein [Caballeronia sp. TF1N1]